ncbi:MAG: hypothetical protein ACREPQ_14020 [Rhodanobacter sp.]
MVIFRSVAGLIVGLIWCSGSYAQSQSTQDALDAGQRAAAQAQSEAAGIAQQSQAAMVQSKQQNASFLAKTASDGKEIKLQALRQAYRQQTGAKGPTGAPVPKDPTAIGDSDAILVFISTAMSPTDFRGALDASAVDKHVHLILRGLPPGTDVIHLQAWLKPWLEPYKGGPVPNIEMNPPMWVKFHVTDAPTAVVTHDGQEVARARGVFSPTWLAQQMRTRKGDLGTFGPMVAPNEVDPAIEVMARAKAFDWDGYKKKMVDGYWTSHQLAALPRARLDSTTFIDPTMVVTRDIVLPNGRVVLRAGQHVNPLQVSPMKTTLLLLDAGDALQRAWVKDQIRALGDAPYTVISVSAPGDWAEWNEWSAAVGVRLYSFVPALAARIPITAVPARVTQFGDRLKVEQIALDIKDSAGGRRAYSHVQGR